MIIKLDERSYDLGFGGGKGNKASLFHQELISARLDELSYLSGFIDGKDRQTPIPDCLYGGVAKDGQAGWKRKG